MNLLETGIVAIDPKWLIGGRNGDSRSEIFRASNVINRAFEPDAAIDLSGAREHNSPVARVGITHLL